MTGPDLRSLTGTASFSEELDEAEGGAVPFIVGQAVGAPAYRAQVFRRPEMRQIVPTIDLDLPPVEAAPRHKGPRWRLGELKASSRRLAEMVPNELERIRRRRVQWLGDL